MPLRWPDFPRPGGCLEWNSGSDHRGLAGSHSRRPAAQSDDRRRRRSCHFRWLRTPGSWEACSWFYVVRPANRQASRMGESPSKVQCPNCFHRMPAPQEWQGRMCRCGKCNQLFAVETQEMPPLLTLPRSETAPSIAGTSALECLRCGRAARAMARRHRTVACSICLPRDFDLDPFPACGQRTDLVSRLAEDGHGVFFTRPESSGKPGDRDGRPDASPFPTSQVDGCPFSVAPVLVRGRGSPPAARGDCRSI